MSAKRIAMVSGAVLLALTATVSAGPMNVTQSKLIAAPQAQTEPVYYRYYHHRHVGFGGASFRDDNGRLALLRRILRIAYLRTLRVLRRAIRIIRRPQRWI